MYPFLNKIWLSPKALAVWLKKITTNFSIQPLGSFSLAAILLIGIFYPNIVYAIKIGSATITTNDIYVASFSMNSGDFQSRSNIFPDRVFFNASGTTNSFTASSFANEFNWQANYPVGSWEHKIVGSNTPFVFYENSLQIKQFPNDFAEAALRGQLMVSSMKLAGNHDIAANIYSNDTNLLKIPSSASMNVTSSPNPSKPHAMVISKSRAYFFWLDGLNNLNIRTYNGSSWTVEAIIPASGINNVYGVSGCLLRDGSDEYIAIAFPTSLTSINIISFKDGQFPVTDTLANLNLVKIDGSQVSISQNPRDSKVYISWLNVDKVHYKSGTFNPAGSPRFSFSPAISVSPTDTFTGAGVTVGGYDNFATDFILPVAAGMKNFYLKGATVVTGNTLSPLGYSAQFPYTEGNEKYIGLLTLSTFSKFDFYRRKLEFPNECSWQNPQKTLHIEGPPLLNTEVRAEVDFAEVVPGDSLGRAVNSSGGYRALNSSYRMIASASANQFMVKFDKSMRTGSYSVLIHNPALINDAVKMIAPDNSLVNLTLTASTATELFFMPDNNLQLDATYTINIASNVIDANGSQIYEDKTLTFTTQTSSSQVQESEILNIEAYSDPARTISIASGSEVNASATLYLRLEAVDPAFNTLDNATVRVILNDAEPGIATLTFTQTVAGSNYFYGSYTLSAPAGGNNIFKFQTAKSSIYHPVAVKFPTLISVSPVDSATGVLINNKPQLTFSENLLAASVTPSTVRLNTGGSPANFSVSISGNVVTIDPNDTSESYLHTETLYEIAAGYGIRDLAGNPFITSPATFTSSFTTQASQTPAISIATMSFYNDSAFSNIVQPGSDYPATGTLYIQFNGVDGQTLTRDYTIASISTGQHATLTETASSSGIYRGSTSFSGLGDRFSLKVQSITSPAASAAILLITYPALAPLSPASGAVNIPVNSSIKIQADEALLASSITAANIKLTLNGTIVATNLSYNALLREITIAPAALLSSEKKYVVSVENLIDIYGNPQLKPLSYSFTIEDKTPPTIVGWYPPDTSTGITIDRMLTIDFSENVSPASVNTTSVKLTRNGVLASYSFTIASARLIIDPDDSPDHGLLTATNYIVEVNTGIKDIAGNSLANVPEPFTISFSTQPLRTPPAAISNLSLYKDPLLITSWGFFEKIPASATVYVKATGADGATQTRDLATVTLGLSWGPAFQIILRETASNSTGIYIGSYSFAATPLYGIPLPQPAVSDGKLTFSVDQAPANAATLTVTFPDLLPLQTTVNSISGEVTAANASNVKIESPVILTFSDDLFDAGIITTLRISSGATDIAAQRTLSPDRRQITITPSAPLPFASTVTVSAIYSDAGLKSMQGNPLFRAFNFAFSTQSTETQPTSISKINLFPDASMSALNSYEANQDFVRTGTMYIEAIGSDASANTVDSTMVNISTGATLKLVETTANSGIFRGSYNYSNLADGFVFNIASVVSPTASQTLKLSIPALSPLQPASGAINVSNYAAIRLKCSEPLNPASVNTSTFKLFKGNTIVDGTLSYLPDDNSIEFIPTQILAYNSDYTYIANGVKDLAGNTSTSDLIVSFKIQTSSIAPVTINSIKVFSDSNFLAQLPDGTMIAPSSQVFLEISAIDLSPTTTDATSIIVSTSVSGNTISTALIETTPDSGLFKGTITLPKDENATLTLSSSTNPAIKTTLTTYSYPRFVSLQPASGSSNLYLDTIFTIETNKAIDAATLSSSTVILANQGIASYQITLSAANKIRIVSELLPSETLHLRVSSQLKDTNGLPFPELLARYSTLTPSVKEFKLYADAGFLSPLSNGAEVEAGQTIFARLIASNSWQTRSETATASFSDGLATTSFTLNEAFPGIFTASFIVANSPDKQLTVTPENLPAMTVTLKILPSFAVTSISPASASINVPSDIWPSWNFTRAVRPEDVNSTNCKLLKLPDLTPVSVSFSLSPSGKQIRMQPNGLLPLLTKFAMYLNQGLRDTTNNLLGKSIVTTFITQPPPLPPSDILSLRNYETADFATPTMAVAVDDSLHLELIANDTSFSTYDTARVRIDSSDSTLEGLELTLIEIAPPSGIYRLSLPINLPPGTTIRIQSQAAPTFIIEVKAQLRTRLINITPASNSTGLYLDNPLALTFSQPIDITTLVNGMQITASAGRIIPFDTAVSEAGRSLSLSPQNAYASATRHTLAINSSLRDINGLFLLPQSAYFATRSEASATYDLLTGLYPLNDQPVSITGEAVRGSVILVASTTNMFFSYSETRIIMLKTATQTFEVTLNESEAGSFKGSFIFPAETDDEVLATLIFGNNPTLPFKLAASPQLLAISPAPGSINVKELPVFSATFSQKISYNTTANALKIVSPGGSVISAIPLEPAVNSSSISWLPSTALPVESSCTVKISGLTDYLGQPLADYQHDFSTGGRQGINVYSDNAFAQLIATNQIDVSQIYLEIAASSTQQLAGRNFMLEARTGTRATETIKLLLEPISVQSGLFRCSLNITPGKAVPEYPLTLLPGEWLELTSPILTDDKKLLYYRHANSTGPLSVTDLRFYSEKNYAKKITEVLTNPSLYIEAEAEDLNWFTSDSTIVKITSDADPTGFSLALQENGTHSSNFRNFIRLSPTATDKTVQTLKVLPDQKIYVESITSSSVRSSIRYLPENGLKHIAVFPSPARGDSATFRFYLNFATDVSLVIFDAAGDEVKGFTIHGQEGENNFCWRFPKHLANGVYFYQMKIDNLTPYPTGKRKERGKFAVLR